MSADEIDAELLAMEDSDDDGEEIDHTQVAEEHSPTPEAQESVEKPEPPAIKRGVAQKVKPRGGRRKRKQESEDEEGDVPPSSPDSQRSADMDESDGEINDDGSPEAEEPLYPVDGKFHDSADRERIMSLPEIEREEILADRAQQVIRRQQDLQLKKALADTKAAASKSKRKASAADLDDGARRITRPKTNKRPTALDDYRRAREQKNAEQSRLESNRTRRDDRPSSSPSDRDADGESEVEYAEPYSTSHRDEPPADLKDFERCRVGRSSFGKVCFYPGFEEAIKGCFCRVSIGINRETGLNQYRMTQIKGFSEGKPYKLEVANGKHIPTDQYAVVTHGAAERPWPFTVCSDGKITEAEYDRFVESVKKDGLKVPTRKFLLAKLDAIHNLLKTEFTEESLQYKIAKQKAMALKMDPAYASKVKREAIVKRRQEAEESGDADEIMKCDAELAALENRVVGQNGITKPKPPITNDRLAQQTQANRAKNTQEVRRALIEEKKKLQRDRDAVSAKRQAEAAAKAKMDAEATKPTNRLAIPKNDLQDLFGESGTDISRAGTPSLRSRAASPMNGVKKEKGPIGALRKKVIEDDIADLDIGIDPDIVI